MQHYLSIFLILMMPLMASGNDSQQVRLAANLQKVSVSIAVNKQIRGSGVLFVNGKDMFVWTAAHVVADQMRVETVVDSETGEERTVVKFSDFTVTKPLISNGRIVGRQDLIARVVRFSPVARGHDLAILHVRHEADPNTTPSTKFYAGSQIPAVGSTVYHVGSFLGEDGESSFSVGVISQLGRIGPQPEYEFDQTTVPAYPGSSGGGVFNRKGECIGFVTNGYDSNFVLFVPIRRVNRFADEVDARWALDSRVAVPENLRLNKLEIPGHAAEIFDEEELGPNVSSASGEVYLYVDRIRLFTDKITSTLICVE